MARRQTRRSVSMRHEYVDALDALGYNKSQLIEDLINDALDGVAAGTVSVEVANGCIDVSESTWRAIFGFSRSKNVAMRRVADDVIGRALDAAGAP